MSVNIKVTGGLNIEWGQIDPKATQGLKKSRAASYSVRQLLVFSVFVFYQYGQIFLNKGSHE